MACNDPQTVEREEGKQGKEGSRGDGKGELGGGSERKGRKEG